MDKMTTELNRLYASRDGSIRAIVLPFDDWTLLCAVANALQTELALPAPVVSISGKQGFYLWLSLDGVPASLAEQFVAQLHRTYFADLPLPREALGAPATLPPFQHPDTGLWAAFINPGLGASFADESGLEMAPPLAAQAALLEGAQSISAAQLQHAMGTPVAAPAAQGLLLKDATLDDIVRHLHALHIEPTFRHLLKR